MDLDPITRREAQKIEEVLCDLATDLELIAYLPEEFNLWLRNDVVSLVERNAEALFGEDLSSSGAAGMAVEDSDERAYLVKAGCFVKAAERYGDPADVEGNEAVLQVNEFNEVERDLLETATTVGHVEMEDIEFHHLSLRALLDTLRDGGYTELMREYLQRHCPVDLDAASPISVALFDKAGDADYEDGSGAGEAAAKAADAVPLGRGLTGAAEEEATHTFDPELACELGLVTDDVSHVQYIAEVLYSLTHLRNASTVNEDIHRYQVLHEAVNKEQSATADVQALNHEYEEVKRSRRVEVAALDDEIERLKQELDYVRKAAEVELEAFHEVSETIHEDHREAYAQQLELHRQAADALATKLEQQQAKHVEDGNQLRTLRAKKEAAVSGAIHEYDQQVRTMTKALHTLQKESEHDTEKIMALEAQLDELNTDKSEYEFEKRVEKQKQEHLDGIAQRQAQSARVVQAYYRAFLARLEVAKAMEKKTKKKKGKKKKSTK